MKDFFVKHFIFIFIVLLAIGLRFNQLGQVPHGMTWDEAAIGYNGHAIFTTRRDEWLEFLPTSFQSFGDYKAPLAIYLNGIFTAVLGMKLWAVRAPFVLAGVGAVWGLMLWVKELFGQKQAWLAGVLLTLSPWHLHFSRAGFETGLALAFFVWGLYFFWLHLKSQDAWWWLALSGLSSIAALYSYHSAKLVVPIVILALLWWQRKKLIEQPWSLLLTAVLTGGSLTPLLLDSIHGHGLERFGTTILDDLQGFELFTTVITQFFIHLRPSFLLGGATTTLRHGGGQFGYMLPSTFILLVVAMIGLILFRARLNFRQRRKDVAWISVLIIVLGLLPAAIGEEVPHSNRALLALPGFILLATLGFDFLQQLATNFKPEKKVGQILVGVFALLHGLFFVSYLNYYYQDFATNSAVAFKDGYLEALNYVVRYENQVDKIVFTSDYGQPYIYALFVRQTNPIWYRGGSLVKYEFKNKINIGDLSRKKTIVVASQDDELDPKQADYLVYGSDQKIRFKIYLPQKLSGELE